MIDLEKNALIGHADGNDLAIIPKMINRHGLVTGATGTGKTVTLQTMAETFSSLGIPVVMTDIKGDLSGICKAGEPKGSIAERIQALHLPDKGYTNTGFPVCFWDALGKQGHPIRTTISNMGPLLLSRLLNLNDVQSGLMTLIFRIADDNGLLLLDMKDLRAMTQFVGDNQAQFKNTYGNISSASVGAIQRNLLALEDQGAHLFFGEPALDIFDLIQTDTDGRGIVNILAAETLMRSPRLYATILLWLLSELYDNLPEVGDAPLPRLVLFFDEAHLLFDGAPKILLEKIEQVVRLIRSKSVGVYFVTQSPADIPDAVLGQLGNKVQHALRAYTPKEQKAIRVAAQSFRPNPAFNTEKVIGELGIGEALLSFLDAKGSPQIVERAFILPPQGNIGPVSTEERAAMLQASPMGKHYDEAIDRESAYELLTARVEQMQREREEEAQRQVAAKEAASRQKEYDSIMREAARREKEQARLEAQARKNDPFNNLLGKVATQATRTATNTVGRELGKTLIRGVLGGLFGSGGKR